MHRDSGIPMRISALEPTRNTDGCNQQIRNTDIGFVGYQCDYISDINPISVFLVSQYGNRIIYWEIKMGENVVTNLQFSVFAISKDKQEMSRRKTRFNHGLKSSLSRSPEV